MSVTAAIRRMLDAGLSIEQALIAAEAFEDSHAPSEPELTKRQARNKRYYKRLKSSENRLNASEQDVSDVVTPSPSPCPLSSPPTPPPIIPQTPSTSPETKRASRLSPDWVLPASWGDWAVKQGYSEAHIRLEADKFRDFWCSKSGKDATKVDWFATWRNWMRNSRNSIRGGSSQPQPTLADGFKQLSEQLRQQDSEHGGPTIEGSYEYRDIEQPRKAIPSPDAEEGQRKRIDGILFDSLPRMHTTRD